MTKQKTGFRKDFLWGAATSAHQVEGGTHNQWTVWELENAKSLAMQSEYQYSDLPVWKDVQKLAKTPANYVSSRATDHYHRYEEDFDLLEKMNMNSYRFSVEWSRIEPSEGSWNSEAVEHYRTYLASLKKRGIEPVVTLFHFTLPVWFAEKGGFAKQANIKHFVNFAEKILSELGSAVTYVITINEPDLYASQSYAEGRWPPAMQSKMSYQNVVRNLATAHNRTAVRLHKIGKNLKISVAKNSAYYYSGDDARLSQSSANWMQFWADDYFLRKVVKNCDFLGINYYFANRVYGYRVHNPDERISDLGWDLAPENLEYALTRLYEKYKLPIMITENGIADASDEQRQWWLTKTIIAMQNAQKDGVKLIGYMHWSLLDNFEWSYGRWPRFGLAKVNYATMDRELRPSALWFAKVLKKIRS